MDEFNDRLSAALAATTQRQLSQLTRDLPHTSVPARPLPQPQSAATGQHTGLPTPASSTRAGSGPAPAAGPGSGRGCSR